MNNILTVIYFSKDRPAQLDLCLRSHNLMSAYELPIANQVVIFKATTKRYKDAYLTLEKEHPYIKFVEEVSFKNDLIKNILDTNFVMFVVDDTIFTQRYNISDVISTLDNEPESIGFSLRLGKNTRYCYSLGRNNIIPDIYDSVCDDNIVYSKLEAWRGNDGDFYYPLEVSSSVYRLGDIFGFLLTGEYTNPNGLEWAMWNSSKHYIKYFPYLFYYKTSVAFSNPVNKVQTVNGNRTGNNPEYSPDLLLTKFEKCGRIKYTFEGFVSDSCHQLVEFEFEEKPCQT